MECTREAFMEHIGKLFDGTTEIPCTYVYKVDVTGDREDLGGQLVSHEAYETWRFSGRNQSGDVCLEWIQIGGRGGTFGHNKDRDIASLNTLFDDLATKQIEIHWYIGAEHSRDMSVFAYGP